MLKFKTTFLLTLILCIGLVNRTFAQGPSYPQPNCMKTNTLQINTGYNYIDNIPYWPEEADRYWAITSAQGYATPMCAFTWWNFSPPSFPTLAVSDPLVRVCTITSARMRRGICVLASRAYA